MRKILFVILIILTLILVIYPKDLSAATSKMYFHYYRFDNDYVNTKVEWWFYGNPTKNSQAFGVENSASFKDGIFDFSFGGQVASIVVGDFFGNIVFNIQKGSIRDDGSSSDRFADTKWVQKDSKGDYHIYLVSGQESFGISLEDKDNHLPDKRYLADVTITKHSGYEENLSIKQNLNSLRFTFNHSINYEITVKDEQGLSLISNKKGNTKEYKITLDSGYFNIEKLYFVEIAYPNINKTELRQVSLKDMYDTFEFESTFNNDYLLGYSINDNYVVFRLWAPNIKNPILNIYDADYGISNVKTSYTMNYIGKGTYEYRIHKTQSLGMYYTYTIQRLFEDQNEIVDPYAYSSGINGLRGYIVDFETINNNLNWKNVELPKTITNWCDYTVYELHVRDLTTHSSWNGNASYRGKYLGLIQTGTTYGSVTTGLDHIKELGVNAIQLLPITQNAIIDESRVNDASYNSFNWGYMPLNYNSLEGSYATNQDGLTKVKEFKQTIKGLSDNGLRVIMDVVYNHTGYRQNSNFYKLLPNYYHRTTKQGTFFNGSGCLNETASDRAMFRKFMLDSIKFWALEYKLSGFRFDLMGLHDVQTMNLIVDMLKEIDSTIIVYGEPWTGGNSGLATNDYRGWEENNLSTYPAKYDHLDVLKAGSFNDKTRDALRGSPDGKDSGWVTGLHDGLTKNEVMYGISGATQILGIGSSIPQLMSIPNDPNRIVNYVSAHDNYTLRDKLFRSLKQKTGLNPNDTQLGMYSVLASGTVILSQGVSFIHAGEELLRSKALPGEDLMNDSLEGIRDSYDQPDSRNQLRWDLKANATINNVFLQYKELINIRSTHNAFRLGSAEKVFNSIAWDHEVGLTWLPSFIVFKILDADQVVTWVCIVGDMGGSNLTIYPGASDYLLLNPLSARRSSITPGPYDSYECYGMAITILRKPTYNVTFHYLTSEGEVTITKPAQKNSVLFTTFDPNLEGYSFEGWYIDEDRTIPFAGIVTSNIDLYAKYAKMHRVNIQSSYVNGFTISDGTLINPLLKTPLPPEMEFMGWYLDIELSVPLPNNYVIRNDITLYPRYKTTIMIAKDSFDSNNHVIFDSLTYYGGESLIKLKRSIPKDQYFMGFYADRDYSIELKIIYDNMVVYSKYGVIVKIVVNFDTMEYIEYLLSAQGTSIKNITPPFGYTKNNTTFVGWYLDRGLTRKADMSTLIDRNMTLYPKYKYLFVISPVVMILIGVLFISGGIGLYVLLDFKKKRKGKVM